MQIIGVVHFWTTDKLVTVQLHFTTLPPPLGLTDTDFTNGQYFSNLMETIVK